MPTVELKENKCCISFLKPCPEFLKSLAHANIVTAIKISSNYKGLQMYAKKICFLDELMKAGSIGYNKSVLLIWCLINQIHSLERNGVTFYRLEPSKILVIDDQQFFYLGQEEIYPLALRNDENGKERKSIQFTSPFSKSGYLSPECLAIDFIPASLHWKSVYYSLAALVLEAALSRSVNTIFDELKDLPDLLAPIKHTKMYWFLLRNLDTDYDKRALIFI